MTASMPNKQNPMPEDGDPSIPTMAGRFHSPTACSGHDRQHRYCSIHHPHPFIDIYHHHSQHPPIIITTPLLNHHSIPIVIPFFGLDGHSDGPVETCWVEGIEPAPGECVVLFKGIAFDVFEPFMVEKAVSNRLTMDRATHEVPIPMSTGGGDGNSDLILSCPVRGLLHSTQLFWIYVAAFLLPRCLAEVRLGSGFSIGMSTGGVDGHSPLSPFLRAWRCGEPGKSFLTCLAAFLLTRCLAEGGSDCFLAMVILTGGAHGDSAAHDPVAAIRCARVLVLASIAGPFITRCHEVTRSFWPIGIGICTPGVDGDTHRAARCLSAGSCFSSCCLAVVCIARCGGSRCIGSCEGRRVR